MKLSDKIFVLEAIKLLDMQNKPIDHVIHSLMHEENLNTYFDVNVYATKATGYEMRPINQDGDETPFIGGSPTTLIQGSVKKILEADVANENEIYVLRFEHEGTLYCGADGSDLKEIILRSSDIYFKKSEFDSYQDVPAYLDKNHDCYAPELDLAIQLHQAIFIDGYKSHDSNREARVRSWLKRQCPDEKFSNFAIERLSTVIGIETQKKKEKTT